MPEHMRDHAVETGFGGGTVQFLADRVGGQAAALVGEQEVSEFAGARVSQRAAWGAGFGDPVDDLKGFVVDGHHPLVEQFAERHFQPGALPGDLVHAVQLERGQLADAQPGGAQEQQSVGDQPVR